MWLHAHGWSGEVVGLGCVLVLGCRGTLCTGSGMGMWPSLGDCLGCGPSCCGVSLGGYVLLKQMDVLPCPEVLFALGLNQVASGC